MQGYLSNCKQMVSVKEANMSLKNSRVAYVHANMGYKRLLSILLIFRET